MDSIITAKDLNYKIGKKEILKNINLNIKTGSFVSIIGPNSSGKTTLLKLLAGILPNKDSITIGYAYLDLKNKNKDILKIGFSIPDINIFLFDDVFHELSFVLENINTPSKDIQKEIIKIANFFSINGLLDKKTKDLTNEEKQIVSIVIALIHKPQVLILDNPFKMMHVKTRNYIISKLKYLQKEKNLTIIISSNNLEDIIFTDYTYVLNNGTIALEGNTLSVFKEDLYLKRLGLELPFSINLSMMLKFYELLDDYYLDYNEVIDKLWN